MKCPIDGAELVMTERSEVEIDHCPRCRGIWLDRGELDKIIERSASAPTDRSAGPGPRRDEEDYAQASGRGKKRGGFLDELFDF